MELQALLQVTRPLRYLCQDETRLGRKTETKRVITRRGGETESDSSMASRGLLAVWGRRT
jgi:hypothetical protein